MPLFTNFWQKAVVFSLLLALLFINLYMQHLAFVRFLDEPEPRACGEIISISKTKKDRLIAKIKLDDVGTLFTGLAKREKFKVGHRICLDFYTIEVDFAHFISGKFFANSKNRSLDTSQNKSEIGLAQKAREKILSFIYAQHSDERVAEIFGSLFMAAPLSKELRAQINLYGANHLLAISGYHLGLISILIFLSFGTLYKALAQRFFPFRDYRVDVWALSFLLLSAYLVLLDFVPSFFRAFTFALCGFVLAIRGFKLANTQTFWLCFFILSALFPALLFNIGFIFSCFGVWFILLFNKHFLKSNLKSYKSYTKLFLINLYIFFAMQPVVLPFFNVVSIQQLLGIFLNFIFILFYPLAALLHIVGLGGILDGMLIGFLDFKLASKEINISPAFIFLYLLISLLAARSKPLALALPFIGLALYAGSLIFE